jgi:hypothetical protein
VAIVVGVRPGSAPATGVDGWILLTEDGRWGYARNGLDSEHGGGNDGEVIAIVSGGRPASRAAETASSPNAVEARNRPCNAVIQRIVRLRRRVWKVQPSFLP